MKTLVFDPVFFERAQLANILLAEKHEVETAKDGVAALAFVEARAPEVILVEWTAAGSAAFVKQIRATEIGTHTYIVATSSRVTPGDLKLAFQAGVDDFIRKPIARDELIVRIDGMSRIRHWVSRLHAGGASIDLDAAPDVSSSRTWSSVDVAICADVRDMLGMDLSPRDDDDVFKNAILGAELPLTLASDGIEVRVSVAMDAASSRTFAGTLLGDVNADANSVKDMLREIANVAAGCFKRNAATEGHVFTTGLPEDFLPGAFETVAKARRRWLAHCPDAGASLCFEVELLINEKKHVRVRELEEGMVVAHDILNDAGALVMRGGTRITESHIAHLPRVLGESALVLVARSAA